MRYSSRFFLYAPFVLVVCIAAGAMLLWFQASGAWAERIAAMNGHEIAPGITLSYTSETIGGFPFRVDTVFKNFKISVAGAGTWQSDAFAMHALTYGHGQAVFEAAGNQTFIWTGKNGAPHPFNFVPGSVRASAVLNGDALSRFDLVLVALDSQTITVGRGEIHLRRNPTSDAIDLVLSGDAIHLADRPKNISHFRLAAHLTPRAPLNPLLEGRVKWQTAVEDWHKADGRIAVDAIDLNGESGSGVVTLDEQHHPFGYYNLAVQGRKTIGPLDPLY